MHFICAVIWMVIPNHLDTLICSGRIRNHAPLSDCVITIACEWLFPITRESYYNHDYKKELSWCIFSGQTLRSTNNILRLWQKKSKLFPLPLVLKSDQLQRLPSHTRKHVSRPTVFTPTGTNKTQMCHFVYSTSNWRQCFTITRKHMKGIFDTSSKILWSDLYICFLLPYLILLTYE